MRAVRGKDVMALPEGTLLHVGGLLTLREPRLFIKGENTGPMNLRAAAYDKPDDPLTINIDETSWVFVVEETEKALLEETCKNISCLTPTVYLDYDPHNDGYVWLVFYLFGYPPIVIRDIVIERGSSPYDSLVPSH
jgi:hypothetical protein